MTTENEKSEEEIYSDRMYRINDALGALASELGVVWDTQEEADRALNGATHEVADRFQIAPEG